MGAVSSYGGIQPLQMWVQLNFLPADAFRWLKEEPGGQGAQGWNPWRLASRGMDQGRLGGAGGLGSWPGEAVTARASIKVLPNLHVVPLPITFLL